MIVTRNSTFFYKFIDGGNVFLLKVPTAMPAKQQIKSKIKCNTSNKASTNKASTNKANKVKVAKHRNKVLLTNKVLNKQRMLQARKEDDEDAREHEDFLQDQERKAAATSEKYTC